MSCIIWQWNLRQATCLSSHKNEEKAEKWQCIRYLHTFHFIYKKELRTIKDISESFENAEQLACAANKMLIQTHSWSQYYRSKETDDMMLHFASQVSEKFGFWVWPPLIIQSQSCFITQIFHFNTCVLKYFFFMRIRPFQNLTNRKDGARMSANETRRNSCPLIEGEVQWDADFIHTILTLTTSEIQSDQLLMEKASQLINHE